MRNFSKSARFFSITLVAALAFTSIDSFAGGTPFTRAKQRGYSYVHRPYYKTYQGSTKRKGLFHKLGL